MNTILQLRKQTILHYEGGEAVWSSPVVLASSPSYKFLLETLKQFQEKAREENVLDKTKFWITPEPPAEGAPAKHTRIPVHIICRREK